MKNYRFLFYAVFLLTALVACQSSAPPYISVFNVNELFRDKRFELVFATDFSDKRLDQFRVWQADAFHFSDGALVVENNGLESWPNIYRAEVFRPGSLVVLRFSASGDAKATFEITRNRKGWENGSEFDVERYTIIQNLSMDICLKREGSLTTHQMAWHSRSIRNALDREYLAAFHFDREGIIHAYLIDYQGEGESNHFWEQQTDLSMPWDVYTACGNGKMRILEYMEYREID